MSKFDLDYNHISASLNKKAFNYEDVKDKLVRVAFDLVRFTDSASDELWQIQNADDGSPVIVALYEEAQEGNAKEAAWHVSVNKTAGDFNVFYKQEHIAKFAASSLGVEPSDLDTVRRFLPKRLETDKKLAAALLDSLTTTERIDLLRRHPELA